MRKSGRHTRGFWISEVLIALWLLTFIGAGLIATFAYLAKGSQISSERAAAQLLADELIQAALRGGPPEWGQESLSGTSTSQVGDAESSVKLDWTITPTELREAPLGKLFELKIQVRWQDRSGEGAQGVERGRGELVRVRQVYVEDI